MHGLYVHVVVLACRTPSAVRHMNGSALGGGAGACRVGAPLCVQDTTRVTCVAFSADARIIVSGATDKQVRVWDAATAQRAAMLQVGRLFMLSFIRMSKL